MERNNDIFICNVCGEEYIGDKRPWVCQICGTADSYDKINEKKYDDEDIYYDDYDDFYDEDEYN